MKKVIISFLALLSFIYIYKSNQYTIPKEAIRFRILANSNKLYDQNIKIAVKDVIEEKLSLLVRNSKNIDQTRKIIKENIPKLEKIVSKTLKKLNYNKDFEVKYGQNYFPKKTFKGKNYKEGEYESLVIVLGDGKGSNWWCVLYPQLCGGKSIKNYNKKPKYSMYLKEKHKSKRITK